ncbi:MAG TPA: ATP-binding protein, partial [Bacteroidia bacterium]|nr:ATP-binding protein [Bacteroidia bacterium]
QFIPTLQTILFACAGTDKAEQQLSYRELALEGSLLKRQIVTLRSFEYSEPVISDKELIPDLAEEYVHFILQGRQPRPDFGKNFPAKILVTDKGWDQLVLNPFTRKNIDLLIDWVENSVSFSEQTKKFFNPGYPALFFGPPGTGKSLTAALIGKHCGLNVFRVDASRIVSKYIGETEKNLVALFERMKLENDRQSKKPILFFDEADVLFSKRTEVKDAKDKWANMETSVLLPLIEEYGGLVVVATNLEYNLDPAMDRRFQLKIKFPALSYTERILIWEKGLPPAYSYPSPNSAAELARYKMTPASIINVLKGGCMQAHKRGSTIVTGKDMEYFISLEFAKSGLTPSWENKQGEKPEPAKTLLS